MKVKNKNKELKNQNLKFKTAIFLRCIDCQGYELKRGVGCGLTSCPLFPFQPKPGVLKNKRFSRLVSEFKKINNGQMVVDTNFWSNEFNKLEISLKKKPSNSK